MRRRHIGLRSRMIPPKPSPATGLARKIGEFVGEARRSRRVVWQAPEGLESATMDRPRKARTGIR
jgi:hypothetical protein